MRIVPWLVGLVCALPSCVEQGGGAPASLSAPLEAAALGAPARFTLFESGPVRPLALSQDGNQLFAVNTPDGRLEIFRVTAQGLKHRGSVPVGLEPVAVAVRGSEAWVVNHLSDSVSIVDVGDLDDARVVRTLLVGDEPRDIVFAGEGRRRAFITTAHRGQNHPQDPELLTPGVGRADVWVFDAEALGDAFGGTPLAIVNLFTDTPRALAVSPDGSRVYAAGFNTGNRTSVVHELHVPDGGEANGGLPAPNVSVHGEAQPEAGLIVRFDGSGWRDQLDRSWDHVMNFTLPDRDVFVVDATATPPRQLEGAAGAFAGVGTTLFDMAVNPVSGAVYVGNTEALNTTRFEGPGGGGSTVRGHIAESRVTVLAGGTVTPRHLNKHIDYGACCAPVPNSENARSLAFPQALAVSADGQRLYVAGFGSARIGVYDTAALEADTFVPGAQQIPLTGGGPAGLVLDEDRGRLYVLTRFDNTVSVVALATGLETSRHPLPNPEPDSVVRGRPFLYDAAGTSSHGDSACASCHVFGDFDGLAWDLGDPDGLSLENPNPIQPMLLIPHPADDTFKAMKGPMVTQSLRGMANHGPMHWRGDRTGGRDAPSAQPDSGAFDEHAAFVAFNVAFPGLVGRHAPLPAEDMAAFADFMLQVSYPPNPIRALDNGLTPPQQAGRDHFFRPLTSLLQFACADCHTLDPTGNEAHDVAFPGFFGTDGRSVFETSDPFLPQAIKIPHLRNLYQKVGAFGMAPTGLTGGTPVWVGEQVRGFGFIHDGSIDSIPSFMASLAFADILTPNGFPLGPAGDEARAEVAAFLFAFDTNLAPIVGQQITLTRDGDLASLARVTLLEARADEGECELVAKTRGGRELGFIYVGGAYAPDRAGQPPLSPAAMRDLAASPRAEVTFTCVPIGTGRRAGVDADLDGALDGDEHAAGTDPRDAASHP